MRFFAALWLAVVLLAGGYLALRVHEGLTFRTDLMALLPREQQNPVLQQADDAVTKSLSKKIVILVGNTDRAMARDAAGAITQRLMQSGLVDMTTTGFSKDQLQKIGKLYFPYRSGLLSVTDRQLLQEGKGQILAARALSQAYGFIGLSDARLLQNDPFLLLPNFFTGLPVPFSRLSPDDGMLSLRANGKIWIMIAANIKGEPFALDTQKSLVTLYNDIVSTEKARHQGLEVLHLGAIFFADAGAKQAMHETSIIGLASVVGTVLLLLSVFRAISPLFLILLTVSVGIISALSSCLWIFGELHVVALLFGVSLIGVVVDYSLQYCGEIFMLPFGSPRERLKRVVIGITIGTTTAAIGYLTFLLAPFPGLRQVAAFSVLGLIASWFTAVAWLPILDRMKPPSHGAAMLRISTAYMDFWQKAENRQMRNYIAATVLLLSLIGLTRFHVDDDIRHLQSPSSSLMTEQHRIQDLIGVDNSTQFFLVQASDNELALQIEEKLATRLRPLVTQGALTGFQSLSDYIPSIAQQKLNRQLVQNQLYKPYAGQQERQLALVSRLSPFDADATFLTPKILQQDGTSPAFLSLLSLGRVDNSVLLTVMLSGLKNQTAVSDAARGLPGVRLIDPVGDYSRLLEKYRGRALHLLILSALLMTPVLLWRYGLYRGFTVILPPVLSAFMTPGLRALAGGSFTFFDAMALVLILAIGADYAVFCAETTTPRRAVTMLSVALAACTALLSFGLLTFSGVAAVSNFGATMLTGICIAFLLAPIAKILENKT